MSKSALPIKGLKTGARIKSCLIQWIIIGMLCIFSIQPGRVSGQSTDNRQKFFDLITGDSVKLYCNLLYGFTSVTCPDFVRYCRLDDSGSFNSVFIDISRDSVTIATGRYAHGIKDGYFEIFYPDGSPKSKGWYKDNRPADDWFYYYQNGLPERHLRFTDTDTLVIMANTAKGDAPVVQGNGQFDLSVEPRQNFAGLWAKGEVKDGKRIGKWTSYFPAGENIRGKKIEYSNEVFIDGKLTSGQRPGLDKHKIQYNDFSSFQLFMPPDIVRMEKFEFYSCQAMYRPPPFPKLVSKSYFDQVIQGVFAENSNRFGGWIDQLKIKITVDENGAPTHFESSNITDPMSRRLIQVIRGQIRWKPAEKDKKKVVSTVTLTVDYRDFGAGYSWRYSIGR